MDLANTARRHSTRSMQNRRWNHHRCFSSPAALMGRHVDKVSASTPRLTWCIFPALSAGSPGSYRRRKSAGVRPQEFPPSSCSHPLYATSAFVLSTEETHFASRYGRRHLCDPHLDSIGPPPPSPTPNPLPALLRLQRKPRAGEEAWARGEGGGGRGEGIANHIMGHEINPPSPNIWPSLHLTLKELFLFSRPGSRLRRPPPSPSRSTPPTVPTMASCPPGGRYSNSIFPSPPLTIPCNFISLRSVS